MKGIFKTKVLVPLLLLIMLVTMIGSSLGDSGIEDERPHIVAGYSYLTTGDYRINPEHGPLIKDIAAFPLLFGGFNFPYDYWSENLNSQWELGRKFLYDSGNNPDKILFMSRFPIMLISLLLGYFVFRWAKELYGEKAGLFALFLYVFDANIIAHSRFVTTDIGIAAAFIINLYYLWKFLEKPTKKSLIIAGLTFGVVMISKFSAALLLPIYFFILIMELMKKKKGKSDVRFLNGLYDKALLKRGLSYLLSFSIIGLIGIAVMYVFYVPHVWNMTNETAQALISENLPGHWATPMLRSLFEVPFMKPIAQYLLGFFMVSGHVTGGHRVFFMGEVANGFSNYYIIAFLIKTAIPTILLFGATLFIMTRKSIKERKLDYNKLYLLVPVVVFYGIALKGSLNLGIRYLVPIFPFIFIFMSDVINKVDVEKAKQLFKGKLNVAVLGSFVFLALFTWYGVGSLRTYPHYLSYFNESIGGSKNGIKYITDSNLDWGQGLKRLSQYVDSNSINKIYVDYFGSGDVDYYLGNKGIKWKAEFGKPSGGYYAISASSYSLVTSDNKDTGEPINAEYAWIKDLEPIDTVSGGSIIIFNLDQ